MQRTLGTCYYPEHWSSDIWQDDARRMAEAGLTWVRIGEFAWSRIEPAPGELNWEWLDQAIDILGQAGLKVVLGTPTATPPRWVLDKHPDMLAVDDQGRPRKFGSRRHYCFSHAGYRDECRRIVRLMAERYGQNPHVEAWQTDNEYGCHDTALSYSNAARQGFRKWLGAQFSADGHLDGIHALNRDWGNVFWSMEYNSFDDIDLPNLTVTEPNPSHVLAFRRYTSDQVVAFNLAQVEIIRAHTKAPIAHNYMGRETNFDHFKVGADLDIASWDSYPLGFLVSKTGADVEKQRRFAHQGDPDFQAFHHDLYRAVGRGRWWIMEQQPGPVNWAPYNPAPLPGMVRLWSWEAFAHGAEAVCYFRWRQAPFAQEQMHAGMLRPDSKDAPAIVEARQVAAEMQQAPEVQPAQTQVAIIFDYDADWAWKIQPQGAGLCYFDLVFSHYRALRRAGLSVDILPPDCLDFSGYALILAPGMMHMPVALKQTLADSEAQILIGPRSAARDENMAIPVPLPPAFPGLDVTVSCVETLRPDMPVPLATGGAAVGYLEEIEGTADVVLQTSTGAAVAMQTGNVTYMGGWGDDDALDVLIDGLCTRAGLRTLSLPDGVRVRDTATERFWFNYTNRTVPTEAGLLPPAGVLRVELT